MRLAPALTGCTLFLATTVHAAETQAVLAGARHRIESTDARATGRLVHVEASGTRSSNAVAIKAHWFPGVLRVLVEIVPARTPAAEANPQADPGTSPATNKDARVSLLLEMRPSGQSTIRVFRPHESVPALLPFSKWGEPVSGSDFNYEDFLQPEYYWQGQTILKTARLGARTCDVLKSTAGASDRSHYLNVQTWIDQAIQYPVYVEKTLKDAGVVKEFTSSGVAQTGGVWAARQVEVKTHGRPGSTLLLLERGSAKANLTVKDFSPEQISKFEDHP